LSLFKPPQVWDFLQVFFLYDRPVPHRLLGVRISAYILTLKGRGFNTTTYSLIYGFALFMAFLGYNFYGWLSDRTGRKILTQWYCVFLVVSEYRFSTSSIMRPSSAIYSWQLLEQ